MTVLVESAHSEDLRRRSALAARKGRKPRKWSIEPSIVNDLVESSRRLQLSVRPLEKQALVGCLDLQPLSCSLNNLGLAVGGARGSLNAIAVGLLTQPASVSLEVSIQTQ